jgi:hypothetical protein
MGSTTTKVSGRRGTISDLREKHLKLLQSENIEGKDKFIPKMAYIPQGEDDRVIAFFLSELLGGQDIYTEFVSVDLIPDSAERTLWKWPYNPEFETEYKKSEPHPATGHCRYMVPIEELINVAEPDKSIERRAPVAKVKEVVVVEKSKPVSKLRTSNKDEPQLKMEIPDDVPTPEEVEANEPHVNLGTDASLELMTIKDKAVIEWKLPVSDKPWLNELINNNFKQTILITR